MTSSKADKTQPRPPQVTMAGWVSVVGSVFLVMGLYDAVASLRTIENRERTEDLLKDPQFKTLDIGVEQWLDIMHQVYLVAGALAAAAVVLGWYVLRGNNGARIALTVIAFPLFIAGMFAGTITASLVAVSAVILWGRPARDWFAGRPVRQAAAFRQSPPPPVPDPQLPAPGDGAGVAGPGATGTPYPTVPAGDLHVSQAPGPHPGFGLPPVPTTTDRRPGPLLGACITTWVVCGMVAFVSFLSIVALLVSPDLISQARDQQPQVDDLGLSDAEIRATMYWTMGASLVWSVTAAVLALLVFLRKAWARPFLLISTLLTLFASVLLVQALVTIVTGVAAAVSAYLLMRSEVTRWLQRR